MDSKHSQLWRIHNSVANLTPSTTQLECFNHSASPHWFKPLDHNRVSNNIPQQKKEVVAEAHTNLTNMLVNNPEHLLIYTDGSQTNTGSNGTGLVVTHAQHPYQEAQWNLGRHIEVNDAEWFGILQATLYARQCLEDNTNTNTIWIFIDNQAAIRRCTKPHPSPGQHLSLQIIENLQTILAIRPNIRVNIQWIPGPAEVLANEIADKCAKQAVELPQ